MLRFAPVAGLFALILSGTATAAGPYDDLLQHVPSHTNTLALIDVKAAFASPLAKKEKWDEKGTPDNRGGLGFVPRDAELVVIAADVNFNTLSRDAQIGLVKVRNVPTMRDVATREGGTSDEIADRLAVLSPRDIYITTLSASELAVVYPADRQYTARWLRAVKAKKTGDLSPYLKKVADKAADSTLTIALDLEDMVDKTILKVTLPASPSVNKVKGLDINLLSIFLSGIKGITFSAKVTDSITGSLAVEFVGDPSRYRKTLPDLFRELIEGQGIAIDGFEGWEPKFTETTMTLTGSLTTADLKRIISLFAFPSPAGERDPDVKGNAPSVGMTKPLPYGSGHDPDRHQEAQDEPELREDGNVAREGRRPDRAIEPAGCGPHRDGCGSASGEAVACHRREPPRCAH